jgi:hypothetical protein
MKIISNNYENCDLFEIQNTGSKYEEETPRRDIPMPEPSLNKKNKEKSKVKENVPSSEDRIQVYRNNIIKNKRKDKI